MQRLAMDLRVLSRELALYLEHQVRIGFFGSGMGLSLIIGFSVAYACYYLSSIAKKPQLVTGGESFSRFLQDHCPVVTETYYPTIWCWESRGQTLLRPFITTKPLVQYRNELIKTADGGQISLDWSDNDNSLCYVDASTRPTILLLPGLTGTSKESYILHMIRLSEELGYRCVVFNNRGVAGENLLEENQPSDIGKYSGDHFHLPDEENETLGEQESETGSLHVPVLLRTIRLKLPLLFIKYQEFSKHGAQF